MKPSTRIRPDETPDILDYFYGRNYNSVYTENSLTYYFNGEAGTRRMRLAALRHPSQLAQLKPERLVRPKVRKAFPDTAFWAADITTDRAGHAEAKVPFPDSLTTWRATARGVDAGSALRRRDIKDDRPQEPDRAPGRSALLRTGRRSCHFRTGA